MPLESSESSKSSESDEFDLERLIQSSHLRRMLMDKNPSKWAISERDQDNDDDDEDDDVASSSGSSEMNIPKTRSDWTRRSRQNARGKRRGGKMSRSSTNEDEYDEDTGRDPLPSAPGPYHALQLAANRLTGDFQDEIAQQLEYVEEQLEAVGLQMQEAIAAGFKDGTFKTRIWSSDVEATEPQSFSADIQVSPVGSRKGSASIPKLRDSGSQTSPTCMQYSTHASTHPFLSKHEYTTEARQPQAGDDKEPPCFSKKKKKKKKEPPCQSGCHLVTSKYEDKHENDVAATSSNAQQYVPHNCGFEYNILKLEGMDPDSKGLTSIESIVYGDSTPSDHTQKTQGESKLYQARGCQTCRCHSCRIPSDSVQTVQILGVVGCSPGESSTSRSREFVTMGIKKGRIPQSLGLIEICRDFEAQKGQYEHIWKQASALEPFKVERSSTEIMDSSVEDKISRLLVTKSRKPSKLEGRSIRDPFQEADGSLVETSEEPETKICRNGVQKSKSIRQGLITSSKGRGVQRLGNLYDEGETSVEQSSSLISCADLVQEADQSKENCEESETRTWQSFTSKSKPPPERSISLERRGVHELENLYDVVEYPARKSRSRNSGAEILHKVDESRLENFEEPETRWQDHALNIKSKLVRDLRNNSESRGVQKLGSLQDEAEHATGQYSSVILKADLLQEAGQSSKENSEEPKVKKWEGSAFKSKSLRERTISLEGQDYQELTHLFDETAYAVGHSSAGRTSHLNENSEEPEKRKLRCAVQNSKPSGERQARVEGRGVQELGSLHNETEFSVGQSSSAVNRLERDKEPSDYTNALRSSHGNDSTRNIRSEIFSIVDEEFEYSASRSTDDLLEVEGLVGRKERNYTMESETHSVLQMQRHSSSPVQDIEAQSCKNRDIEAVRFQEDHILSGPRQSQSDEKRRSKSNVNPYHNPSHYSTRSCSHQKLKQKSDRVDRTSRDRDLRSSLTFAEEGTVSLRPEEETSRNVVASRKVETKTKSQPLVAPMSNYESTPSVGGVSSQRLAARACRRSALDYLLDKHRPDSRPSSSEKRTEIGTDEAPKERVAQSRVYTGIRHEYESEDHVSHQEMQGRMRDEIAKEFSLLGIHSQIPSSRKSLRSKSKSGVRCPSNHSHQNINVRRPETFQLEEDSRSLHNSYREDIDLRSKAPRMCSLNGIPTKVNYDIPIEYSSTGQIGAVEEGALNQSLQDGRVYLEHQDPRGEPRAITTQRLADVGRSKRRSKTAQRPKFEQDEFVEPQIADSNTDLTHRRLTSYPLSSRAPARLPKEELIRQLQSPQKLEEFPSKRTVECTQESDKPHWAGDGWFSVTKASSSDDCEAPNLGKKWDVNLQILNRKSSRSGGRRKNRETSVQHTVISIPRGCSLKPKPELTPLSSPQDSTLHMDSTNTNVIHGPQYTESIQSSIPLKSRPSTLPPVPPSFRDSETREFREQEPPTRHPTMIYEDWNDPSILDDLVENEDRNSQELKKQNLKTLSSKSSQKYLAKMLTRLSQKLAVLESKGLFESNVQTQPSQHFDPRGIPTGSGDQYRTPGPLTTRQGRVESELRQQFDRLRPRKSQDFGNSMQRRSQRPFQEDLSIETKDTLSWSFVDEDDQKTSDTSTKWSHRSSRSSMLTNNLKLLAMDIASKRDQSREVEAKSKHRSQDLPENHVMRADADSRSRAHRDVQTQMSPSFKDRTLIRSSQHPSERTENRESPNRISTQTQTLDGTNAQDEMQSKGGYEVLSHPSIHHNTFATTGAFREHHLPPNSEESPWDRSLEGWNPRASKGGQLRQEVDSMMKTKEQSQAQTRNGTSTQTDEFGPTGTLTLEPQFRHHSRSQRVESMETQPRDLDYIGNQYLEHPLPQLGDSFYLRGQQDSRFHQITEAGSHQHPMSQSQRMSGIPLQPEEDVVKNLQLSQSQLPQSDLEDMVSRNSHRPHNQKMEDTEVQHGTVRGMGGMNVMNLPRHPHVPMPQEFQTEWMHSFAGQSNSNKPHHLADTVANSHQHFQDDSMHSFGVPETVVSGFPHHSQTGGIYSHVVQPDHGFPNHSQSERKYDQAIQPEGITLEMHHPPQSGGMYRSVVQPEGLDASLHSSDLEGVHTFAVHPDDIDFGSSRPPTFKNIYNIELEREVQNPHHLHLSQKEQMYSSQVQRGSAEPGSRHLSRIDRMHSFALQPENSDSGIRKTSQKQIPVIRASHHSVVRRLENSSKDLEALPSERGAGEEKTSSVRHSLIDLPPEVLSLGSKNPRKSSQIQMLNDMLQDREVTVSKSRRNSQARMKSHMLEHKFDLVAGSKSQELPKNIKFQAPEDEQSNLGEKVEENFNNFDRETSDSLESENLESPGENRETFLGDGEQFDSESVHPFENELPESQREFESEKSESHTFEGGNFDNLESEQSGTPMDTKDRHHSSSSSSQQQ